MTYSSVVREELPVSVCLSVSLWRKCIAHYSKFRFKFRTQFTAHCGRGACGREHWTIYSSVGTREGIIAGKSKGSSRAMLGPLVEIFWRTDVQKEQHSDTHMDPVISWYVDNLHHVELVYAVSLVSTRPPTRLDRNGGGRNWRGGGVGSVGCLDALSGGRLIDRM